MTLLDVKQVQKIYHTRFGAMQVEALKDITFRKRGICCHYG